jgi:gas vesicle protein
MLELNTIKNRNAPRSTKMGLLSRFPSAAPANPWQPSPRFGALIEQEANKISTHTASRYASLELIMDTWKFWMAFGVGVAAGAAVALLYAPQPGDRTRKQIKRGLEDASDQIKTTAEDFSEKAEQYGKQAERVIRRGREVVDDTISKAGSVASKVSGFI